MWTTNRTRGLLSLNQVRYPLSHRFHPIDTDTYLTIDTDTHLTIDTDTYLTIDTDTYLTIDTDTYLTIDTDIDIKYLGKLWSCTFSEVSKWGEVIV